MIKSFKIFNFQSHKESELLLHKGVNIIVGSSDSGKTAILRALKWVKDNRPSGDSFRSDWGGETSVELQTDEDVSVIRTKGKTDSYTTHVTGEEDVIYKALGTGVPDEVNKLLCLNEINIQEQHDSPFLLTETSGKIAEHWNKIAHLEKIDIATSNVNSAIRELTSDIKYKEDQQATQLEELKKFEHLEKFEIEVEVLEELDKRYTNALQRQTKLETLINNIKGISSDIKELQPLFELEKPIEQIFLWKAEKETLELNKRKLSNLFTRLELDKEELEEQKQILVIEKPVNDLLGLYNDLNMAEEARRGLYKALSSINGINIRLDREKALHVKLKKEFEDAMPVGSLCPLCGSKIN
jgi:DNA repair exonuclease SbcCD ATPase subunit